MLGPLWAQPEEQFVPVSQTGAGQAASRQRLWGIDTFIPPKSSLHGISSSLAVALDILLKYILFKPNAEPRSPQSSLQPYYNAIASQICSTALISSLQAFKFVDGFLL